MSILRNIFKSKTRAFYFIWIFVGVLVSYTLVLFFYLKIVGVYGIAELKEAVSTSEGIDIKYEFSYEGNKYTGVFTAGSKFKLGDKYFVLFSKHNPEKNLLQYNHPVPNCLKDSINFYWVTYPKCLP